MPALFGYLVALTLLLGGGYAGLQWLASPDVASTHQRVGEKPIARNLPRKSEQSEFNAARATAVPGEADGESQIATTASTTPAMEAPQKSDPAASETATISTPGDPTPGANNDHAAAGCMPFGVTARGADVFPIQCQALIERRRGSAPSSPPPPAAPASGEVQAAELAKPMDTAVAGPKDGVAATRGTKTTNTEPEPRPGRSAEASRESSRDAAHQDDAQARDIAGTSKPEPRVKPAKQDKRQVKRNARSSRSKLVKMYMRTIEFPDGHQEQQLLPIRRSRGIVVEDDDEW